MISFLLIVTDAAGPLARAEWSWATGPDASTRAIEAALVDAAAASLRGDPRVAETGLRVDAGCSRARCTLALDGLAGPLSRALPALRAVATAEDRHLSPAARRALRKAWRRGWRSPSRVFDAAIRRATEGDPLPGGARPRLGTVREDAVWDQLRRSAAFDLAGALPIEVQDGVEEWLADVPGAPPLSRDTTPTPGLMVVDWPGAARAQVALVWPSGPDDAGRDAWLAGDFESALVQRLRETDGLTYDVEPLYGDGWAGAAFDVAPEAAAAAIAAAKAELARPPAVPDEARRAAHLRLVGRAQGLHDTLAGQLAITRLPPLPELDAPFAAVGPLSVVVVGDAERLGLGETPIDRRSFWAAP